MLVQGPSGDLSTIVLWVFGLRAERDAPDLLPDVAGIFSLAGR